MRKRTLFAILFLSIIVSKAQNSFSFLGGIHNASVSPNYLTYPDTVKKNLNNKIGVELGIVVNFEIKKGFSFRTGIIFSARGSKWTQFYDTTNLIQRTTNVLPRYKNLLFSEKTVLTTNYFNAPLDLIYSLRLSKKVKFVIGAGPVFSLVSTCHTEIDRLSFSQEPTSNLIAHIDKLFIDLPIGKSPGSVRVAHLGYNAFAGFDFGKMSLSFKYSEDINEFFEDQGRNYKHKTLGIILGINIPSIDGKSLK